MCFCPRRARRIAVIVKIMFWLLYTCSPYLLADHSGPSKQACGGEGNGCRFPVTSMTFSTFLIGIYKSV